MTVRVDTGTYLCSHGRTPRGTGLWYFTLHRDGSFTETSFQGSFTDARRWAVQEARDLGCSVVTVQP